MVQARLHQIIHNVSNLPGEAEPRKTSLSVLAHITQSDKTREIWPILINYLLGVRPGQARAGQRRIWF